ncbi:MAG: Protein involved in biosynthesis of mitomycin antibiotics/polyketide fumonisin, partial [Paenibacillaceae bacterium]|nr:Protein involved in biosynthesis of mitomycin antibiotics/polyketide fumonisin [Paenibacillaceae bacterium]
LSDLPNVNAGNFSVWPGSHHLYERYFRELGPESLLSGMPPVDLPEPRQIIGQAGDAVFCHYQLAHGIAPNVSPNVRYAVFFRLRHVDHATDWKAPMTDLWLHWPGIRELK